VSRKKVSTLLSTKPLGFRIFWPFSILFSPLEAGINTPQFCVIYLRTSLMTSKLTHQKSQLIFSLHVKINRIMIED